jgi:hypothetical protein
VRSLFPYEEISIVNIWQEKRIFASVGQVKMGGTSKEQLGLRIEFTKEHGPLMRAVITFWVEKRLLITER